MLSGILPNAKYRHESLVFVELKVLEYHLRILNIGKFVIFLDIINFLKHNLLQLFSIYMDLSIFII